MRLVLISDTHCRHGELELPHGDVLIHAGDFSNAGTMSEVDDFARWLHTQPHAHKVIVAGNHDRVFESDPLVAQQRLVGVTYLQDASTTIDRVRFYGSPWQPWCYDWAFNLERGAPLREKWMLIPRDVDVLITHSPPDGHGDVGRYGEAVGCKDLRETVLDRAPRLHVFGHIHEGRGITHEGETHFVNASSMRGFESPLADPIVVDLEQDGAVTVVKGVN